MIRYATDENYRDLIMEDEVTLVDFTATWCMPCKALGRILEDIDDEMPFLNIIKVDVDDCPKTSEEYKVNGIPDLYYIKNGETVCHGPGAADADEIRQKISELLYN